MWGRARCIGMLVAAGLLMVSRTPAARQLTGLPERINLPVGARQTLPVGWPGQVDVRSDAAGSVRLNGRAAAPVWAPVASPGVEIQPLRVGRFHLQFRLLGVIPLRNVTIDALPDIDVVPGGQAIGVLLDQTGALVVGETSFRGSSGRRLEPARAAGLRVGDLILRVDGEPVEARSSVARAVQAAGRAGEPLRLRVRRGARNLSLSVRPAFAPGSGRYLIGAWVRDGASGIGTLTFYDPQRHVFAALGHVVADAGTGKPFPVYDGRIVAAAVSGVQRGRSGDPGEKLGMLVDAGSPWGRIASNTAFGIFGDLLTTPPGGLVTREVPIAAEDQVHPGPAQVLTVLKGRRVQSFAIDIERVLPQNKPSSKGLILRVTDPRLLAATGGIVQGMSGSPILQRGRLVGAVTHVFIHDPTRGYGVLAVWMAEQAGLYGPAHASAAAGG